MARPPASPSRPWPADWPFDPRACLSRSTEAMVASTDQLASEVGVRILDRGGNATDTAVAMAFALAVVNPEAGNVGGGGFLIHRSPEGSEAALDFRSTAPSAAFPAMFLDEAGDPTDRSVRGCTAAAVPGSVAGLWEAHRRFGRLPWAPLLEPAIGLANGFTVTQRFLDSFEPHIVSGLGSFEESARIFLPDGAPPPLGSVFRQGDLAETLTRIAHDGPDGFYAGRTADLIEAQVRSEGGLMTRDDLLAYEPVWRTPVRVEYRGLTILSMPPASSGGLTLAAIVNILATYDLGALPWHGIDHLHVLVEAWRRAFADRNHYLADPAFVEMPIDILASAEYGRWRAREIAPGWATPSARVGPGADRYRDVSKAFGTSPGAGPKEADHTTHLSVVDREGGAVSLTTTVNTWYGGKSVVAGGGFILNNELDDFTTKPGHPNFFGLVQGEANIIEPGKRSLSAMTPTMVLSSNGALRMVIGTPGGATIITTTFQDISNVVDFGMGLGEAICSPRLHHQHLPDRIDWEPGGLPEEVLAGLQHRGHVLRERQEWSGDTQAISVSADGVLEGCSDPRRGGVAMGL